MESAYGRPTPMHDAELTHVGPGTPAGELFRRSRHVGWILPIDDTHTRMYSLLRVPVRDGRPVLPPRASHGGKRWSELSEEEHQRMPGDKEAVVSQLVRREIERVQRDEDPAGVIRDPAADLVATTAGNWISEREGASR